MHIPQRMCVVCRRMKPKNELIKVVRTDGGAELDKKQNKFGRGAYVCKNAECVGNAKKRRAFSKHFKCQLDDGLYEELAAELESERN
ncbi:MAG: YlxR family protein [Clostridiales bacterium]|nr:YlxR family protein [Clostridiales bacterium]